MKIIIVVLILLLSSCENSTEINFYDADSLIPFAIGNQWQYEVSQYKFDRSDSSTYFFDSTSTNMEILSLDTLKSFIGYDIERIPFWFSYSPESKVYYYKDDGLYYAQSAGPIYPQPPPSERKLLSYPTKMGEIHNYGSFEIKTQSVGEIVKINSKKYPCVHYSVFSDGEIVGELWITPGIGIIKSWQYFGINTYYYKLKNYIIN